MFEAKAPSQTMRKSRTASAARAVPGVKGTSPSLRPSPVSSTSGAGGRRSCVSRPANLPRCQPVPRSLRGLAASVNAQKGEKQKRVGSDPVGHEGARRDHTEAAGAEVVDRLLELGLGVHDEGAVP